MHTRSRIKEVRVDAVNFSPETKRRLQVLLSRLGQWYVEVTRDMLYPEHCDVLLLYVYNSDAPTSSSVQKRFSAGKPGMKIASAVAFMSESELAKQSDAAKRSTALTAIHHACIGLANHFGLRGDTLMTRYGNMMRSDFFYQAYSEYKSKDGVYACTIESCENWGSADHRLRIRSMLTGDVMTAPLFKTEYPFFDEMPNVNAENVFDVALNTPQAFSPLEWQDDRFIIGWGIDRYCFDTKTKKIMKLEPATK